MAHVYRPEVAEELGLHGLQPRPHTPPELVRDALRDLYKYEIKVLRSRLLAGDFPKAEYADRVIALRRRYPLLSIRTSLWTHGALDPPVTE